MVRLYTSENGWSLCLLKWPSGSSINMMRCGCRDFERPATVVRARVAPLKWFWNCSLGKSSENSLQYYKHHGRSWLNLYSLIVSLLVTNSYTKMHLQYHTNHFESITVEFDILFFGSFYLYLLFSSVIYVIYFVFFLLFNVFFFPSNIPGML